MTTLLFDRKRVAERRRRAAVNFAAHAFLKEAVIEDMIERFAEARQKPAKVLVMGSYQGRVRQAMLAQQWQPRYLLESDMTEAMLAGAGEAMVIDPEHLPSELVNFEAILSVLQLHTINDVPGALIQCYQALAPQGILLATCFGGTTLQGLYQASMAAEMALGLGSAPRVLPMMDIKTAGGLLQRAGFQAPVVDSHTITVTYPNIMALMQDLHGMGEGNVLIQGSPLSLTRSLIAAIDTHYPERDAEGNLVVRFEILTLMGMRQA
jgi:NADH dehydrogenase [ubiquinone] 1 alpha subcomplex assembly factor 5